MAAGVAYSRRGEKQSPRALLCSWDSLRVGLSPTLLSATTALVLKGGMWDCRGESAAQRGNRAPKNMSQTAQSFVSAKFNRSFELEITTNSCPVFDLSLFPGSRILWVLLSLERQCISPGYQAVQHISSSVDFIHKKPGNTHCTAKENRGLFRAQRKVCSEPERFWVARAAYGSSLQLLC